MNRSAEHDVLLWLLGSVGGRGGLESPTRADWGRVVDLALRHGVGPLLHKRLSALPPEATVPPAARARLREIYLRGGARNLRLFHDLSGILAALRSDGVRAL